MKDVDDGRRLLFNSIAVAPPAGRDASRAVIAVDDVVEPSLSNAAVGGFGEAAAEMGGETNVGCDGTREKFICFLFNVSGAYYGHALQPVASRRPLTVP
jgi:hypothetical protein